MNKKLLALAVGAAVSVPSFALADAPRVYGKVNVSLEQVEEDLSELDEDVDSVWKLSSNASRLGFKGSFDLDVGGLEAIYKLEYEIAVDDGDDVFKQRNIFGGFRGGFGEIIAGNFDTPLKTSQGKIDQFNDIDGDIKTIFAGESRQDNIIQWTSPTLADAIELNVAFSPAEGDDVDGDGEDDDGLADTTYFSAVYDAGGVYLAAAMAQNEDDKGILDTDWSPGEEIADITRLSGGFKADNFQIGAIYQMAESVEDGSDLEADSMLFSGSFTIDRVKLKAQYGVTELDDGSDDAEVTLTAFGADYKLASASKLYAYLASVEADEEFDDLEDSTIGFGFEHKF